MAGHRFTHPQQSESRRVSALSDFDYRVWEQTKLSADDFGVLPFSALPLRTENARLRKATDSDVEGALVRLRTAELLLTFEHQGEVYACAPAWATWQPMNYPRRTIRPRPPVEVLGRCDDLTQRFFTFHPGGQVVPSTRPRREKAAPKGRRSKAFRKDSENVSETLSERSEAGAGGTPSNTNTHSDAQSDTDHRSEGGPGETAPPAQPPRVPPGRPGLVTSPGGWGVRHANHVGEFCDFVCFPSEVFREFVNRVLSVRGLGEATSTEQVTLWAREVRDRYRASGQIPGADIFAFWRNEWAGTHGSNRPSTPPRGHARGLDRLIAQGRSHG